MQDTHAFFVCNVKPNLVRSHDSKRKDLNKVSSYLARMKVISLQRSGTEAIRTQSQPSKPKREITNIIV